MKNSSAKQKICIVGGGPAGIMLGFLLARAGISITILEKHSDFLRDFRGDTVHPSTLQILKETGLLEKFEKLPHRKVEQLSLHVNGRVQPVIDFRGLEPFPYLCLAPQWDFLNLLADEGALYTGFDLRMDHEVTDIIESCGKVTGVKVRTPEGEMVIEADLIVGCDGRNSVVRESAGLDVKDHGAPMDVLWLRIPRYKNDPEDTFGIIGTGHMMVLLNRIDYWQAGFVVPKGGADELREKPVGFLGKSITELAPFLSDRTETPGSWDDVKTLEVRVDRLEQWYRPGVLMIGDAAHAMSPVGGVGINLAIQDAVAAANELIPVVNSGQRIELRNLRAIQKRREFPTRFIQAVQLQLQKRVISRAIAESGYKFEVPVLIRWLLRFRLIRRIPARLFGYGIRREHVDREIR